MNDVLIQLNINDNFNILLNSEGNFKSMAATYDKGDDNPDEDETIFKFQQYISQTITEKEYNIKSDTLQLESLITLPYPAVRFSKINLPATSILEKSNLNLHFLPQYLLKIRVRRVKR